MLAIQCLGKELEVFIFPTDSLFTGEPRSHLEFPNHLIDSIFFCSGFEVLYFYGIIGKPAHVIQGASSDACMPVYIYIYIHITVCVCVFVCVNVCIITHSYDYGLDFVRRFSFDIFDMLRPLQCVAYPRLPAHRLRLFQWRGSPHGHPWHIIPFFPVGNLSLEPMDSHSLKLSNKNAIRGKQIKPHRYRCSATFVPQILCMSSICYLRPNR